jgi:hypothetical protein
MEAGKPSFEAPSNFDRWQRTGFPQRRLRFVFGRRLKVDNRVAPGAFAGPSQGNLLSVSPWMMFAVPVPPVLFLLRRPVNNVVPKALACPKARSSNSASRRRGLMRPTGSNARAFGAPSLLRMLYPLRRRAKEIQSTNARYVYEAEPGRLASRRSARNVVMPATRATSAAAGGKSPCRARRSASQNARCRSELPIQLRDCPIRLAALIGRQPTDALCRASRVRMLGRTPCRPALTRHAQPKSSLSSNSPTPLALTRRCASCPPLRA